MRLVFIIDNTAKLGGGEYSQFQFAQKLALRGHQVTIFAGDKHFLSKELNIPNITVHYRRTLPVLVRRAGIGILNRVWEEIYLRLIISPTIKRLKPDWILGYLRSSAIKAQRVGSAHQVKVANFVYESPPWMKEMLGKEWDEEMKDQTFRRSWERTKKAYEHSTVLITNSLLARKKCKEWLGKGNFSEPVYPGFESRTRKEKKRTNDIVYVGRLNKLKNIDEIFTAAKGKNYSIIIIGEGEQRRNLERMAQEYGIEVTFTGNIPDKEKFRILESSKLLVFPTSFEGFGMPPMEGILSGCSVLCSDLPILKEIYGQDVDYFPLHDTTALARKMRELLSAPRVRSPDRLLRKYNWERSAKTMEHILQRAL